MITVPEVTAHPSAPVVPDVELRAVSKEFGSVTAVDGISLQIGHGEFYSLLGPSGCGKTTTLRMIAGFERPDDGSILIAGNDVTEAPPNRRHVNTVFQHYALFPHLTVEDNVGYGLKQRKLPKEEARTRLDTALATVRLTELRARKPRELSGGQQQRVALARALINEPTVLLLDEPLAALDQKLRKAMQGELTKLQQRVGITFLYVTHDQEEALTLSDRIAVMNGGRILQEGTPDEIYERPASRFVADFIGQTNFLHGVVRESDAASVLVETDGLALRCGPAPWAGTGTRVWVSLRPESIAPANGHQGAEGPRTLANGTLVRRTYLGDVVRYEVLLPGGAQLTLQRQNDPNDTAAGWVVGLPVHLAWDPASCVLLPEEEEDAAGVADEDDIRLLEESRD
jgi:spermidine/putrescine transport system ATP-binding protein